LKDIISATVLTAIKKYEEQAAVKAEEPKKLLNGR
jgi:hypothetical protein